MGGADGLLEPTRGAVRGLRSRLPALGASLAAGWLAAVPAARAELPVPCGACNGGVWVSSGAASLPVDPALNNALRMTVRQETERAILNWQSFNVGEGRTVQFDQRKGESSVALNRIHSADASRILGNLQANGQVYLINQNGILFGPDARVDVNTLVASTLDVAEEVLNGGGIVNAINQGTGRAAFEGASEGSVELAEGAVVRSATGGRVLLVGAEVRNAGRIESKEGQVVLAGAKDKVYLAAAPSDDPNLRGLLVEVETGGDASNLGEIVAERGNVTLLGLAVNQEGVARATTSVSLNGSVRLLARDRADVQPDPQVLGRNVPVVGRRGGVLELGQGSLTEVAPEAGGPGAVDEAEQRVSSVELVGRSVRLGRDAQVLARGGTVSVTASPTPDAPLAPSAGKDEQARVVMEVGSRIDVSGTRTTVPVTRNLRSVELRGNELKDAPLQRDGPLRNRAVVYDVRKGTPLADVSGESAKLERSVQERLGAGGEVTLRSEGEVVLEAGSTIDVSGGHVDFTGGYMGTSKLLTATGEVVDISQARPEVAYLGILGEYRRDYDKWGVVEQFDLFGGRAQRVLDPGSLTGAERLEAFSASSALGQFEQGYREGRDAGTLAIAAANAVLEGALLGGTARGALQRNAPGEVGGVRRPYDQQPLAGRLVLGEESQLAAEVPNFRLGEIRLGAPPAAAPGAALPAERPLWLDPALVARSGFGRLTLLANGRIDLPVGTTLTLPGEGALTVRASALALGGGISARSGTVDLAAVQTVASAAGEAWLALGPGGFIDVAGGWFNDAAAPALPADALDFEGGSVSLAAAGPLTLAPGSRVMADGGAWVEAGGELHAGRGGQIELSVDVTDARALSLGGELTAHGLREGGQLSLEGPGFEFRQGLSAPSLATDLTMLLGPQFLELGGFSEFTFLATHTGLAIAPGTALTPRQRNWRLDPQAPFSPTGGTLATRASPGLLADTERSPVDLRLGFAPKAGVGALDRPVRVGAGARLALEAGGRLTVSAETSVLVAGELSTPAGELTLRVTPPGSRDTGFRADLGIWLEPTARLTADALARPLPDPLGLRSAQLREAGRITLEAERGAVVIAPGARVSADGVAATVDLPTGLGTAFAGTLLPAAAGRIVLTAAEGVLVGGALSARAAPGGLGGELSVRLDANRRNEGGDPTIFESFLLNGSGPRDIVLGGGLEAPLPAGTAVPAAYNGLALLDAAMLQAGGFDVLELRTDPVGSSAPARPDSTAALRLEGDLTVTAGRRMVLDAPTLVSDGGAVRLAAPYLALGHDARYFQSEPAPQAGTGTLLVSADFIDLVGNLSTRGFAGPGAVVAGVQLDARGDLRARGVRFTGLEPVYRGRLRTAGDLTLRAAQVYPATLTDYRIDLEGVGARLTLAEAGASSPPLSAGGSLTLRAPVIEQGGTLRAPFGLIDLQASTALRLQPGSLTSVSGTGLTVPYGQTQFGRDWVYALPGLTRVFGSAPEKAVSLSAPQVEVAPGSRVEVAGGGDLLAYEFIPGPGGSQDVLTAANLAGGFALVPAFGEGFAPFEPAESQGFGYAPGTLYEHGGGGGLTKGRYTVLPARYALLPGAWLLRPTGEEGLQPGEAVSLPDASLRVAGRLGAVGSEAREPLWSGFLLQDGGGVRARSEYLETLGSDFFAGAGAPGEAGRLAISAGASLELGGSLATGGAGAGGLVDVSAANLAVVNVRSGAPGRIELLAGELAGLGAQSLLLGGRRSQAEGGLTLETLASRVRVENGVELLLPELLLAAREEVRVAEDARLAAAGTGAGLGGGALRVPGDGALLRVSSGDQVQVVRSDSPGLMGRLDVAPGATLAGAGSITLDASLDTRFAGALQAGQGSLLLGANRVSLGAVAGVTEGLLLPGELLAGLAARELVLTSRTSIDLYGNLTLPGGQGSTLAELVLDAAALRGLAGARVEVLAGEITLRHGGAAGLSTGSPGAGTLALRASRRLGLEAGDYAAEGFSTLELAAPVVELSGAGTLHSAGGLRVLAAAVGGAGERVLSASGAVELLGPAQPGALSVAPEGLGGRLEAQGASVRLDTRLALASGSVELRAAAGDVRLEAGAHVDTAGRDRRFGEVSVGGPGGQVVLRADAGAVRLAGGARLDVSGGAAGGEAGSLRLLAPAGAVELAEGAVLRGLAGVGGSGGVLEVDAATLTNGYTALNRLALAGGFDAGHSVRLRSGSLELAEGETLRAGAVTLTADAGALLVAGRVDARAAGGGRVRLNAGADLTLAGTGRIDARGERAPGEVLLETRTGSIRLEQTSVAGQAGIEVGAADGVGGLVRLTAARTNASGTAAGDLGLRVARAAASIAGAERIELVGRREYTAGSLSATLLNNITNQATTFAGREAVVLGALGVAGDARYHLMPGAEVRGTGNMTLAADWDFATRRPGGEPGVLTLRAAGDLTLNASLSDGVRGADLGYGTREYADLAGLFGLGGGQHSWSFRLAAGADLASADPLATRAGVGDLRLADNRRVRSGTGTIDIAAGRDVALLGGGSAIYTVGRSRRPDPADFDFLLATGLPASEYIAIVQEFFLAGEFLDSGGDVRIRAGRDVLAVDGGQLWSEWLPRLGGVFVADVSGFSGDPTAPSAVAVAIERFRQGVGALGGGAVSVQAGRDIIDLSASVPRTAMPTGLGLGEAVFAGGGELLLRAGRDLVGGRYLLEEGVGRLRAVGDLRGRGGDLPAAVLALGGDARLDLTAGGRLELETALSPAILPASASQGAQGAGAAERSFYYGYGPEAALALRSVAGEVVLRNGASRVQDLSANLARDTADAAGRTQALTVYPGTLRAAALQGDIRIESGLDLFPSPRGTLELLAAGSVLTEDFVRVTLSDADPARLPGFAQPASALGGSVQFFNPGNVLFHAGRPLHLDDPEPVRVAALGGHVGSERGSLTLNLAKRATIEAAGDIVNLTLVGQHLSAEDLTRLQAGGDLVFPTSRGSSGRFESSASKIIEIGGPGRLDILAGGSIDLGTSAGVRTTGDAGNSALGQISQEGAGILMIAGLNGQAPREDEFLTFHASLLGSGRPELDYLPQPGDVGVGRGGPVYARYFDLVAASGIYALRSGTNDYTLGLEATQALFPGADWSGGISLLLSRVATEDGGSIGLIAPGGGVDAGVTASSEVRKTAAELGVVAQGRGDIAAVVRDDFLVNSSRVFTLGGGDILLWSSEGDIDAGRGAKSAISTPPPFTVTDAEGNTRLVFPPAIQGSGIRTAAAVGSEQPAGDVLLFAPRGTVSAGDAGIGGQNVLVGATQILGADNFDVGGISIGVPAATGVSVAAGLSGVSDVAGNAAEAAGEATQNAGGARDAAQGAEEGLAASSLSIISVEVLGFGEEDLEEG